MNSVINTFLFSAIAFSMYWCFSTLFEHTQDFKGQLEVRSFAARDQIKENERRAKESSQKERNVLSMVAPVTLFPSDETKELKTIEKAPEASADETLEVQSDLDAIEFVE